MKVLSDFVCWSNFSNVKKVLRPLQPSAIKVAAVAAILLATNWLISRCWNKNGVQNDGDPISKPDGDPTSKSGKAHKSANIFLGQYDPKVTIRPGHPDFEALNRRPVPKSGETPLVWFRSNQHRVNKRVLLVKHIADHSPRDVPELGEPKNGEARRYVLPLPEALFKQSKVNYREPELGKPKNVEARRQLIPQSPAPVPFQQPTLNQRLNELINSLKPTKYNSVFHSVLKLIMLKHEQSKKDYDQPGQFLKLAANLSGDQRFKDMTIDLGGKRGNIEGLSSRQAIFFFFQELNKFAKTEKLTTQLNDYLNDYTVLYLSSLLSSLVRSSKGDKQKVLMKVSSYLLGKLISEVQRGNRKSFCWMGGSNDHFIPLRIECEEGGVRIAQFNLGAGAKNKKGIMWLAEGRFGEFLDNGKSKRIICTPNFLNKNLEQMCEEIATSWTQPIGYYTMTMSKFKPQGAQQALMQTVLGNPDRQKIGDCTCKGQWMLIKKAFRRLLVGKMLQHDSRYSAADQLFRKFEHQVLNQVLQDLEKNQDKLNGKDYATVHPIISENVKEKALAL